MQKFPFNKGTNKLKKIFMIVLKFHDCIEFNLKL